MKSSEIIGLYNYTIWYWHHSAQVITIIAAMEMELELPVALAETRMSIISELPHFVLINWFGDQT